MRCRLWRRYGALTAVVAMLASLASLVRGPPPPRPTRDAMRLTLCVVSTAAFVAFLAPAYAEKLAIEPRFHEVTAFNEGVAFAMTNGKFELIDKTGAAITIPTYKYVQEFSEGLSAVATDDKWGFHRRWWSHGYTSTI